MALIKFRTEIEKSDRRARGVRLASSAPCLHGARSEETFVCSSNGTNCFKERESLRMKEIGGGVVAVLFVERKLKLFTRRAVRERTIVGLTFYPVWV